ncbi:hypothetical protein ACFQO1_06305 [Jejudonia soesokkakensis]|uniref:Uncharacterized protein n=1 Tax=Jejudonia soesokkakensis TaxID=1323432 RepID=A0ABW2MX10_9FLAO
MKKIVITCLASVLVMMGVHAQENKTVEKETTVKKVRVSDTKVETKVVAETETESGVIKVEGTSKQDQGSQEIKMKDKDIKVLSDDISIDERNRMRMEAIKQKQQMELQASIAAQKALVEKERKMLEEKKMQMMKDLEARRAALTARPKGMAKLQRDPDGDGIE